MPLARGLVQVGLRKTACVLVDRHRDQISNQFVRRIELELRKYLHGEAADLQRACAGMILLALSQQDRE